MNNRRIALAAAAVAFTALAAGCGGGTTTKVPPSPSATKGTSSPARVKGASVGSKFTIKAEDGTTYDITLVKVVQQATAGSEFETPSANKHLAAAEFRITATTKVDENANNNATAVGSNEQVYDASLSSVAEGTNFDSGDIKLQPGGSLTGWVSFELPNGVKVAKVVWTASAGFSSATCEWLV